MINRERMIFMVAVLIMALLVSTGVVQAGSLEPTDPPGPTMKTLDEIPPTWSQTLQCDAVACPRFELVLGGAGVLDKETGLVWEQSPDTAAKAWYDAIDYCYDKNVGGRGGWRLPTVEELRSLVDPTQTTPALPNGQPFTNVQVNGSYWTATTSVDTNAWHVWFFDGSVSDAGNGPYNVWCVRGGQGYDGRVITNP